MQTNQPTQEVEQSVMKTSDIDTQTATDMIIAQAQSQAVEQKQIMISHGKETHSLGVECSNCDKVLLELPGVDRLVSQAILAERRRVVELINSRPAMTLTNSTNNHPKNVYKLIDRKELLEALKKA